MVRVVVCAAAGCDRTASAAAATMAEAANAVPVKRGMFGSSQIYPPSGHLWTAPVKTHSPTATLRGNAAIIQGVVDRTSLVGLRECSVRLEPIQNGER